MLNVPPTYGIYPWWPQDGEGWIHPADVERARMLIPGGRILRRDRCVGRYLVLTYGELSIRVRPTLWHIVPTDGFDVGDLVEIRSRLGKNWPGIGVIGEMRWNRYRRRIDYFVRRRGMTLPSPYTAEDLRAIENWRGTG